jgi:threonine/homoserine/homoserine lactone efflux protein
MGNIIGGIICIIAGLSGQFVLIGTNSSAALVVVGVGLLIWGLVQTVKKGETETAHHVESASDRPNNNDESRFG